MFRKISYLGFNLQRKEDERWKEFRNKGYFVSGIFPIVPPPTNGELVSARVNSRPELISARRLKRKEKNTGQLQVHRQLPCYDFCLEAGVGKVVTRWLNTVNIFPTSSTVFIHRWEVVIGGCVVGKRLPFHYPPRFLPGEPEV